jgi:hypothetical protein
MADFADALRPNKFTGVHFNLNYSVTVATVRCSNISPLLAAKYPIPKCSKLCAYHTLVPCCRALAKFLV